MPSAISAAHLGKVYTRSSGATAALVDLSLEVPAGGIYGLIGRNGAGKTTFVRIASTQLAASSGRIDVLGLQGGRDDRAIRMKIACVPQESRPLYFLRVEEVVYLYLKLRGIAADEARRRTRDILEELSLTDVRSRLVSSLSGGQRRRTMCAMVLASDAEILFLDEPTTGLDPIARREVWQSIRRTSREHRTILLTTHYLDEVEALSTRLALLERGKLMLEGTPADLRGRVRFPYRVTVQGSLPRSELESYGRVSEIEGGFLVFTREEAARDLARRALEAGARLTLGPVSLEDVFLEVVGRSIEEETTDEGAGEAAA